MTEVRTQVIAPFRRPARRAAAGVLLAALLAGTAGCTGGDDQPSKPVPGASTGTAATLDAKPVPMDVRVTRVAGKLKKSRKADLENSVARAIGSYWNAAYLGGSYPRTDFTHAFPTFSKGAAQKAQRARSFLTNTSLGGTTDSVTAKQKHAWLSVLAPNKVPAGVTARIRLVYVADRSDSPDMRVTITGRLMLTHHEPGRWKIFGYDVARSARPVEKGAGQ